MKCFPESHSALRYRMLLVFSCLVLRECLQGVLSPLSKCDNVMSWRALPNSQQKKCTEADDTEVRD